MKIIPPNFQKAIAEAMKRAGQRILYCIGSPGEWQLLNEERLKDKK